MLHQCSHILIYRVDHEELLGYFNIKQCFPYIQGKIYLSGVDTSKCGEHKKLTSFGIQQRLTVESTNLVRQNSRGINRPSGVCNNQSKIL